MYLISSFELNFFIFDKHLNACRVRKNILEMKDSLLSTKSNTINLSLVFEARQHWIVYVLPSVYVLVGLVGVIPAIFGFGLLRLISFVLIFLLMIGIKQLIAIFRTKIYLTNEYLTISAGIYTTRIIDISLQKLEAIEVSQNLLGKILNFGTLYVSTGEIIQHYRIKDPLLLRSKIIFKN